MHRDGSRQIGKCPDTEPLHIAYTRITTSGSSLKGAEAESLESPQKKRRLDTGELANATPVSGALSRIQYKDPSATAAALADSTQPPGVTTAPLTTSSEPLSPPSLNFYLLLPSTPTSYRVLIPLPPGANLSTALTDRLVLEFPTIYALKQPPDKLPIGFVTEEEYLRSMVEKGQAEQQFAELLSQAQYGGHEGMQETGKQAFDEGALKDVLKRDLVSVVGAG